MVERQTVQIDPSQLVTGKARTDNSLFHKARDKGKTFPPVVAFADVSSNGRTELLVVDGTNRVETARQRGESVETMIIDDPEYLIGKVPILVMALTRVFGIRNK